MKKTQSLLALRAVILFVAITARAGLADEPALKAVGVLGNSAGLSDRPVPYAFYTGIGLDARGRLYLAGADSGVPVCDQDGHCLAVIPLPDNEGMVPRSLVARAGDFIFLVAHHPAQARSALYRIDTKPDSADKLKAERVMTGPGIWAISPLPDAAGKVIIGQSEPDKLKYSVSAVEPASGAATALFTIDQPKGATRPWRHIIQVEPDGQIDVIHSGGINWSGRYSAKGEKGAEALDGLIVNGLRYHFGYDGEQRRMDLTNTKPAPGDCGSPAHEIRMPAQMVETGGRFFFVGRGGALEAKWGGTTFQYTRRIGGIYVEDLADSGASLLAVAFTAAGNNDVQHPVEIPKNQPIGELLHADAPLHGKNVLAFVPAPEGMVCLYRGGKGISAAYEGSARHLDFDVALPEVKEAGQAAVLQNDLLLADPAAGVVWRRPLLDKQATVKPWLTDRAGVRAVAVTADAIYLATAQQVAALSLDGQKTLWTAPEAYKGIRRLAATPDHVYVCDTVANVVDQLDARTGARRARLGTPDQPGPSLKQLNRPYAVAADLNAVYIADNGNGRVVVATTTLWRPDITALPREDKTPITAVKIPVKPPAKGRMSLNIYDQQDLTVRQLVCAEPSGTAVVWDGKDLYDCWVPPGTYRYHGIIAPKLSLRYVTSIGQSGTPPYRTEDGKGSWGGVWGYVMDVCPVTPDTNSDILVLWAFEEGEGGLIRMSQDGEVRWKQHLDWWMKANQVSVASDGKSVFIAAASALGAPEGQSQYNGESNRPLLWRVDVATGARRPFEGTDQQNQRMFGAYLKGGRVVTDIAVRDGKVYLSAPAQNTLFVADAESGKELAAWHVEGVSGIAFDAQGRLLAGSGTRIVALDGEGKVTSTVAEAGGEVWDVDMAPGGEIVASVGAPRHQVVFFLPTGKEARAIGARGGRPLCGKMQPESFLNPVGICVAGNGRLFVAENAAPKRFTRWSASGTLEREFHGPYYFSGMFGIDEDEPEYVYGDTHSDIIRYKVDYASGKWNVDSYWIGVYRGTDNSSQQGAAPVKWWPRIRHHEGKTFWCSGSGEIVELKPDGFRHVAAVWGGWVEKGPDGNYVPLIHTKKTNLKGTWSDLNGDGRTQPEEWQVTEQPVYPIKGSGPQQGWGAYFDERFDLYMHDWTDDDVGGVWKIPVSEWRNGVPVYRWDQARHVGLPLYHGLGHGGSGARTAFAANGATYAFNGGYNAAGFPGVGHGHDWEFAQITKYDEASGKPLWHAGERASGFIAPGQNYCPTGPAGLIGDYLFWTDENSLVHVWDDRHGLYVDTLLDDISRGPVPTPYTVWVELFNTRVFKHAKTGKVYLLAPSDAIHVYEVLATDQKIARFSGEVKITEQGLDAARKQLALRMPAKGRTLSIPRTRSPVSPDATLAEFAKAPAAPMVLSEKAQGTARLLYDDKCLYVAFEVKDDSPWKNAGGDASTLFKTGDTVDLWFGPSNTKRPLDEKDVRILFAPGGDKVQVVAFRPKVAKDAKRVPFRSPSGEVWMDKVESLSDVQAAVKVSESGYTLKAAIPWTDLGLTAPPEHVGLDLSINFSDPAGQRNVARLHWGRNGAAIVYDLPSEARFEPETWGVGAFEK